MSKSRPPDLRVSILHKPTGDSNREAGVAWLNEDGSVTVKLRPGVVLTHDPDIVITLFPKDEKS